MANSNTKVLCKNVFKHNNKDEIKKEFTEKWIDIIKLLEQFPKRT